MTWVFYFNMENRINELEKQMEQLQNGLLQIVDKMHEMSEKINDLHSKPQSIMDRLILPEQVKESVVETSNEKVLQEEGLVDGYFYIRNDFPTAKVFYISKGVEKIIPTYNGVVYLGGNRSEGIPGKKYDILELTNKYFPKQ